MTAVTTSSSQPARLTGKQIAINGLLAIAVAIGANVVARFILVALATIPVDFPPMQLPAIAFFTALYGVGATVVYWLINRLASNPPRVWLIVVLVGFVVTALPNLMLAANPAAAPFPGGTAQLFSLLLVYLALAAQFEGEGLNQAHGGEPDAVRQNQVGDGLLDRIRSDGQHAGGTPSTCP
jgi:hypothetical protein